MPREHSDGRNAQLKKKDKTFFFKSKSSVFAHFFLLYLLQILYTHKNIFDNYGAGI
jgi:hypothetical protein